MQSSSRSHGCSDFLSNFFCDLRVEVLPHTPMNYNFLLLLNCKISLSISPIVFTHGNNNLPIPAIAYFINTLDSQGSVTGRPAGAGQYSCMLGTFFIKLLTITEPTFRVLTIKGVYEVNYSWYGQLIVAVCTCKCHFKPK